MEQVSMIGIDLAKNGFQLHGARRDRSVAFRKKLSRACQFRPKISHLCRPKISHFERAVVPPGAVWGCWARWSC
ncbi:MAG: hypothetical protein F4Y62_09025, partial [Rhodospirillaceae bacterium]|nr:hypothetical protein [Rhodospirillaceae bacterium]